MMSVDDPILGLIFIAAKVLALWLVLSVFGWLLYTGIERLIPAGLRATVQKLVTLGTAPRDIIGRYLEKLAEIRSRIFGADAVRVLMERKHKALAGNLQGLKSDLNEQLMRISAASSMGSGQSLITLLSGFRGNVEKAQQFGEIEDGLVDKTVQHAKARGRLLLGLFASLLIALFNGMLLYVFFRDFEVGVFIPFTRIDIIITAAIMLPIVEFLTGFLTEYFTDAEKKSVGAEVTRWAIILPLAGFEYLIFFLLLRNAAENADLLDFNYLIPFFSIVGPALALFQSMAGAGAGKALRSKTEFDVERSIKDQISDANKFVSALPARYEAIGASARGAAQALDQLANDLKGNEDANAPIVDAVDEKRRQFLKAIDGVAPSQWPQDLEGNKQDGHDNSRLAWLLPPITAALVVAFVILLKGFLDRCGLFGADAEVSRFAAALAAASTCFIGGLFLFKRLGLVARQGENIRDTLFPRDDLFRVINIVIAALLAFAIVAAGVAADGWYGLIGGIITVAFGAGLSFLGSYSDMIARGFVFLLLTGLHLLFTLFESIAFFLIKLVAAALALLLTAVYWVSFLVGWPLIRAIEQLRRTPAPAAIAVT